MRSKISKFAGFKKTQKDKYHKNETINLQIKKIKVYIKDYFMAKK